MKITGNLGDRAGLGALKQALALYALRQKILARNIANAEVPGYSPLAVKPPSAFTRLLEGREGVRVVTTDPRHLPGRSGGTGPRVVAEEGGEVEVDGEMASLAENQLAYRLAVRLLEGKYKQLHSAITGTVK